MTTTYFHDEGHAAPKPKRQNNRTTAPLLTLAATFGVKPITIVRAIHGPNARYVRGSNPEVPLANLAFAWQATPQFLTAVLDGRDVAICRDEVAAILQAPVRSFDEWRVHPRYAIRFRPASTNRAAPVGQGAGSGRGTVRWSKVKIEAHKADLEHDPDWMKQRAKANASQAKGARP